MGYLPIFLDVTGRRCLVVGSGPIAERRATALLEAGAAVTIVSPALTETLQALAAQGRITHLAGEYRSDDMDGAAVVFAITDDPALRHSLAGDAAQRGIAINIADAPEFCSFIAPAVVRRGRLQLAISTAGASPALAARLRGALEDQFGPEYAVGVEVLAAARAWLRPREADAAERSRRLSTLAASRLFDMIGAGDDRAVDRLLRECLGREASLAALGLDALATGHGQFRQRSE
jgi:siroheme synthase-like protein